MADFNIFGVKSRKDDTLISSFPSIPTKSCNNNPSIEQQDKKPSIVQQEYDKISKSNKISIDSTKFATLKEEIVKYFDKPEESSGGLPLNFGSIEEEIGFVFLEDALNFGSRFDRILQQKTRGQRESKETIQFGLLSMFISGKPPHFTETMVNATTPHVIATEFDFPIHESKALDFAKAGGVYQDVEGPLHPFAELVTKVFNEIGILLRARQMNHLGEFILQIYRQSNKDVKRFIENIEKALPFTFSDVRKGFPFLCKAQRATIRLASRFPEHIFFDNLNELKAPVDSQLVFSLRKLGILIVNEELSKIIDSTDEVLTFGGSDEYSLRLSALFAVEQIALNTHIPEIKISEWINRKANLITNQSMKKHLCETQFY